MSQQKRKLEFRFPPFYPKQKQLVFAQERLVCSLASVQCGKTAALLCLAIKEALTMGQGKTIWWIAPYAATSMIAWRRLVIQVQQNLPKNMYSINVQYKFIDFVGHARIKFISADNTAGLFGETCDLIIADETALISKESWSAILSRTTQTGARIFCASNLHGRNWYWELCQQIKAGKIKDSRYIEITIDDAIKAGIVQKSTVDLIKSTMPVARFQELYYCIPADDSENPFGISDIEQCIVDNIDDYTPVAYGLDLGKSVDSTALAGINLDNCLCKLDSWVGHSWEYTINRVCMVDGVSTTPLLVDSTGLGDPVAEQLGNRLNTVIPYRFTMKSKTLLIESLILAIQSHKIKIPRQFEQLITELKNYGQERSETGYISYNARTGHDDMVIALALALHCKNKYISTCSFLPSVIGQQDEQGLNYANELGWLDVYGGN